MNPLAFKISIRGDLLAALPRLTSEAAMAKELKREMDFQNDQTVTHIQIRYLSYLWNEPTKPDGLRAITGRLRNAMRVVPATITAGGGVIGGVSNNVKYAKYHELGFDGEETVRPHLRRVFKNLSFKFGGRARTRKVRQADTFVGSFTRVMHMPARAPMQRGIQDRLGNYTAAFNAAISKLVKP
jgi:hypothetical protein